MMKKQRTNRRINSREEESGLWNLAPGDLWFDEALEERRIHGGGGRGELGLVKDGRDGMID